MCHLETQFVQALVDHVRKAARQYTGIMWIGSCHDEFEQIAHFIQEIEVDMVLLVFLHDF